MIYIGLNPEEKRTEIQKYLDDHQDTDRIFVFHGDKEPPAMNFPNLETYYVEYPKTEMYRTFYPLLGQPYKGQNVPAITSKSLLIVDEFMVTKNRSDLKYNCTKHYLRVSDRHIVFNYFPFISEFNDFMILADMDQPDIYKNMSFSDEILNKTHPIGFSHLPDISSFDIEISDKDREKYEEKKEDLFENLGQKDPDTIPRNLALFAGTLKKKAIKPDSKYVARNSRFKKENVFTYKDAPEADIYYLLDMHYRFKDFEHFLRIAKPKEVVYVSTGLSVDKVFTEQLEEWYDKMEEFYEKANLHR